MALIFISIVLGEGRACRLWGDIKGRVGDLGEMLQASYIWNNKKKHPFLQITPRSQASRVQDKVQRREGQIAEKFDRYITIQSFYLK